MAIHPDSVCEVCETMNLRFVLALAASKCVYHGMRLLGRQASYLPGYFAVRICPDFLRRVRKAATVICVTGTDGKTTTANLLSDLLASCGKTVANNRMGSNTEYGIATAMACSVSLGNRCRVDAVVLEVDEHYARIVCPKVRCDYLIITNVLRDSLQRNAHPEYVAGKLQKIDCPSAKLILNADELCSALLLEKNDRVCYGITRRPEDVTAPPNRVNDCPDCPRCGAALHFDYVRYAHVGHVHCDKCGFASPEASWVVTALDAEHRRLTVRHEGAEYDLHMIHDSLFNIYNELAAVVTMHEMGLPMDTICAALEKTALTKTRLAEEQVRGVALVSMMSKSNNSLPVSMVFDYIRKKPGRKAVILALDDLDERRSSERIGWIYDTDYEFLNDKNVVQILAAGVRCYDHEVRLLLAGIPREKLTCGEDELAVIEQLRCGEVDSVYLLHDMSSYARSVTAMEKLRKVLEGAL